MKKHMRIIILFCLVHIILLAITACGGGSSLPNGEYTGPGVTAFASESVSYFLPENFTVKGDKIVFTMNFASEGSNDFRDISIEYTYKIAGDELRLTNSSGDNSGVYTFAVKDKKTVIIGGEEYIRK